MSTYVESIGEAAGDLWRALSESETFLSTAQLARRTKLPDHLVYAAIGWLAREGKVDLSREGRKIEVFLR